MKKAIFVPVFMLLLAHAFISKAEDNTSNNSPSWDFIKTGFLTKDFTVSTFRKDIRIQLAGSYTTDDSILVSGIVSEIEALIETVDVNMVSNEGNLILTINGDSTRTSNFDNGIRQGGVFSVSDINGAIGKVGLKLNFDSTIPREQRNKVIQYKLIRGLIPLCNFYFNTLDETKEINTTGIFSQTDYKQVSLNHFDKEVIEILYSKKFFLNFFTQYPSEYLKYATRNTFKKIYSGYFSSQLALLVLLIYGLVVLKFWSFNEGRNRLLKLCLNGIMLAMPVFILEFGEIVHKLQTPGFIFPVLLIIILFFSIIIVGLLSACFVYLAERFLLRKNRHQLLFYISEFVLTFLSGLLGIFIFTHIYKYAYGYREIFSIYVFLIAAISVGLNFINEKSSRRIKEKELQLAKMEELKTKAELQAIQSRVNPHFLYNSLNSIASLAISNPETTRKMALSLSEFCRFALNKSNSDTVLVKDEIKMVASYLEIEKVRFGEKLNFSFKVDENIDNAGIPRFIIQPLIENAIKHGASKITDTCEIRLHVKSENKGISIVVSDNGPSFPELPVYGYGLQSIFDKLEILFEGKAKINWNNTPEKSISIWLPIPNNSK